MWAVRSIGHRVQSTEYGVRKLKSPWDLRSLSFEGVSINSIPATLILGQSHHSGSWNDLIVFLSTSTEYLRSTECEVRIYEYTVYIQCLGILNIQANLDVCTHLMSPCTPYVGRCAIRRVGRLYTPLLRRSARTIPLCLRSRQHYQLLFWAELGCFPYPCSILPILYSVRVLRVPYALPTRP